MNNSITKNTALAAIYIVLSLIVGEVHPFSNFPVYNRLPNWSYVFYLTDENGDVLPWYDYTTTDSGEFAQKYYTIALKNNIEYGHGLDDKSDMQKIVTTIINQGDVTFKTQADTIQINRRYYHIENNSIVKNDTAIITVKANE